MNISSILSIFFIMAACCPDPDDLPCPPYCDPTDTSDTIRGGLPYDLIWQVPLFKDTLYSITVFFNTSFKNNIIFASKRKGWTYNEEVIACDANGNIIWEWEDYISPPKDISCFPQFSNEELFITTGREVHGIELQTGKTTFQTRKEGYPVPDYEISYTAGILYHVWNNKGGTGNSKSTLMEFNKYSKTWEEVYSVFKTDEYGVLIYPPSSWINENGDTILVIPERKYNETGVGKRLRVDLHSYNATTDTLMWIAKDIDTTTAAGILTNVNNPPIIDGDRVYLLTDGILYCFNRNSGRLIWNTKFALEYEGGALFNNYILADDKICFVTDDGYLIGIDKYWGKLIYRKYQGGGSSHISYYNGRLYYTSNGLYIADAKNGNLLHQWKTHNYSKRTAGEFSNGVAINPELGVMYLNDGFYLMCIRLPE